jgi:hypothetical protein
VTWAQLGSRHVLYQRVRTDVTKGNAEVASSDLVARRGRVSPKEALRVDFWRDDAAENVPHASRHRELSRPVPYRPNGLGDGLRCRRGKCNPWRCAAGR